MAKEMHNMLVEITSSKRSDSTCTARNHSFSNKSYLPKHSNSIAYYHVNLALQFDIGCRISVI